MKNFNLRRVCLVLADMSVSVLSCFMSIMIINEFAINNMRLSFVEYAPVITVYTAVSAIMLIICGAYNNIWRYAQIKDFLKCFVGSILGALCTIGVLSLYKSYRTLSYSRSFLIIAFFISTFGIIVLRTLYSSFFSFYIRQLKSAQNRRRTLIVGAGSAAQQIIGEILDSDCEYDPIGIVDDDSSKSRGYIRDIKIMGATEDIPRLCKKYDISIILIAIPSCSTDERNRIVDIASKTDCEIKILPYIHDILNSDKLVAQAKDINIEELLGRDVITFEDTAVNRLVRGKICMVTGGGGSIGSELCRQIAKYKPHELIIVDIYENNAYEIQQELIRKYGDSLSMKVEIASVRDYQKMDLIFSTYRPELVFHAAAHKHVPLMETNPEEAVKNNIVGTYNTATLADLYKVKKFVLISTDKAVNPTNVMGATKRCCEMIVQNMAQNSKLTQFVTVRFGNVLGSNGSVIPLFERQIKEGGPITVTHPEIIRYFMTIPEAVSLILQAASFAQGGEIFVLDMGDPVKIVTLAENLIKMHGKRPYKDIKIEFTGLRPGEKLYEELLMDEEGLQETDNRKIFIGHQIKVDEKMLLNNLELIRRIAEANDKEGVIELLQQIVPTFKHKTANSEVDKNDKKGKSSASPAAVG